MVNQIAALSAPESAPYIPGCAPFGSDIMCWIAPPAAYEIHEGGRPRGTEFTAVEMGGKEVVAAAAPETTLLLCWPVRKISRGG
eukprot:5860307-Pyramimonas_sp.AAC.3